MNSFSLRRFPCILLGICLLSGGCRSVDSAPPYSDETGFYSPPQFRTTQPSASKPSWLKSWFAPEEQGPAKSIDEFMSLERPE
jgi:hypothetical protein